MALKGTVRFELPMKGLALCSHMCAAMHMVLLPEYNIGNVINGVLEGWMRPSCSIVHILQAGS